MSNRVQRALARRERMRRSRDQAWLYFAGFAAAAVFGWVLAVSQLTSTPRGAWWALLFYSVIAVASTLIAYRAFGAAKRLSRRLDESQPLDETHEPDRSAWDEIWRRSS